MQPLPPAKRRPGWNTGGIASNGREKTASDAAKTTTEKNGNISFLIFMEKIYPPPDFFVKGKNGETFAFVLKIR
jgi:hypothetical protein